MDYNFFIPIITIFYSTKSRNANITQRRLTFVNVRVYKNVHSNKNVFSHVASIYANLLEQNIAFASEKSSTPTGKPF